MEPKSRGGGTATAWGVKSEEPEGEAARSLALVLSGENWGAVTVDLERTRAGGAGGRTRGLFAALPVRSDEDVTGDGLALSEGEDDVDEGHSADVSTSFAPLFRPPSDDPDSALGPALSSTTPAPSTGFFRGGGLGSFFFFFFFQ